MSTTIIGGADGPTSIYLVTHGVDRPATIASMFIIILAAVALLMLLLWAKKKWRKAKQG